MFIYRVPYPINKSRLKVLTCMKSHKLTLISRHQTCVTNLFIIQIVTTLYHTHTPTQRVKETGETQRKPLTVSPVNKCHIQKEKESYNGARYKPMKPSSVMVTNFSHCSTII